MSNHILIVDDDPDIGATLQEYLASNGYETSVAEGGHAMRQRMSETEVDLILLDLGLPDENGLELLKKLRNDSDIPVIVVTGRGDEVDRIVGLEIGADDYIPKPFSPRELLARVRTVLRRSQPAQGTANVSKGKSSEIAQFEDWTLNLGSRLLSSSNREPTQLTTAEFNLLESFLSNPNRVLSRDHLLDLVYGADYYAADRIIDTLVMRLRRKIEKNRDTPALITTVRNAGYMFSGEVNWSQD